MSFIVSIALLRHESLTASHIKFLVLPLPFVVILQVSMARSGLHRARKLAFRSPQLARMYAMQLKSTPARMTLIGVGALFPFLAYIPLRPFWML